jgi:conjugative relaxase-like TrwC/TraI family protein
MTFSSLCLTPESPVSRPRRATRRKSSTRLALWDADRCGCAHGSRLPYEAVPSVISLRRLSVGAGYKYLMRSIAAGDGPLNHDVTSLANYYSASGTPAGRFLGRGLASLDGGNGVAKGTIVEDEHLRRMLHECADPITGQQLASKRVRANGVGSFDLTFSPSKSVSVAWALGDRATRDVIYRCHQAAITYVLDYAEREVFRVRAGTNGVVVDETNGVIAAAFTHFDSRAGDPQLHDHVVVMNRAQSARDGVWRTLDSRAIFASTVELSELHQGVLADLLCQELGWDFDARTRRHSSAPKWEVTGVADDLMAEFSRRSEGIELEKIRLITQFEGDHGRLPTDVEVLRLRQTATLATRPAKRGHSLTSLTEEWTSRAQPYLDTDPGAFVAGLAGDRTVLSASNVTPEAVAALGQTALEIVATKRATFSLSNLRTESNRLLQGRRFTSPAQREQVVLAVADSAVGAAVLLNAPEPHTVPDFLRRLDGTSRFTSTAHHLYSSHLILDAENRLLAAAELLGATTVSRTTIERVTSNPLPGRTFALSADQATAVTDVATSGRMLDLLSAPAGSGKTTTMAGLKAAWEADHGAGSVLGLAPSAAAAEVLGQELDIDTDNVAKFLYEHRLEGQRRRELEALHTQVNGRWARGFAPTDRQVDAINEREAALAKWTLSAGQLLIVDEASLASTFDLDELVSAASDAGSKVLLLGDPFQLASVDAGGMFTTLVAARPDVATLSTVHRFSTSWESEASMLLRAGHHAAFYAYQARGRIVDGGREQLLERIYAAWSSDVASGFEAIMLAADAATVHELNTRARLERVARGEVTGQCALAQGHAGVGDVVVTRENRRRLTTSDGGWVKNGDAWRVESLSDDGSLVLTRTTSGARVVVDATYAATNVELGYATTLHRAQGRTVDRAHCYVTPRASRELLYVAMTRGRDLNLAYVDTAYDIDPATSHDGLAETQSLEEVFRSILRNVGSSRSATDVINASFELADSVPALLAEYTTIVQLADTTDWVALVHDALDDTGLAGDVVAAGGFDALVSTLRRAQGRGIDLATTLPGLVAVRELGTATDMATVLDYRLTRWLDNVRSAAPDDLIAGLFPAAVGDFSPDVVTSLNERRRALETRCEVAIERAFEAGEPWVGELGPVPDGEAALDWRDHAVIVAAYRERWGIDNPYVALGTSPTSSTAQRAHHARARVALIELAPSNCGPDTHGSPTTLHRDGLSGPTSWSLATLDEQLNLAREAYRRAEASLGVAALIETLELQTLRDEIDDLKQRRAASPESAAFEVQLNLARETYQRAEASLGVAALIETLELQTLHDEAIAAEDAVNARRRQLNATLGHDVLEGEALSRDVAVVRSHIAWSDAVLADQARSEDPQLFARRRLEVEIRELRRQINAATPESAADRGVNRDVVSDEREQLQYSLATLTADYELITGAVDNPLQLAQVLEGVDARHCVDREWLAEQKAALAAIEAEDAAQLAYEQRERAAVTTTSYEPAYEPEPTVDHGFAIEPEL